MFSLLPQLFYYLVMFQICLTYSTGDIHQYHRSDKINDLSLNAEIIHHCPYSVDHKIHIEDDLCVICHQSHLYDGVEPVPALYNIFVLL